MSVDRSAVAFLVRLISGARPVVIGADGAERTVLDLPERAVYFANHSSHLDFLTIWAVLPGVRRATTRPVAAADYWGDGTKGKIAERLFRPLLVERGGKRTPPPAGQPKPPSQVERLVAALDAGESLILFPEGTRGDGESIADFHAGLARIAAARPDMPLVPVALANLGRILPKGGVIPVPLIGTATFLPALARGADEDEATFLTRARGVLVEALGLIDSEQVVS